MNRSRIVLPALAVLGLASCRDLGLEGNLPLAEAEHKELRPLTAQAHPASEAGHAGVMLNGTRWVDAGLPEAIPARDMRVIGQGHGHPLYALRWDDAPYDRIYALRSDGRWQPHNPIRGVNTTGREPDIVH